MIKTNKGLVQLVGSENELLSDFVVIVNTLYHNAHISKEELRDSFERSFRTKEEFEKDIQETIDKIKEKNPVEAEICEGIFELVKSLGKKRKSDD